jgi:hypothetical protein
VVNCRAWRSSTRDTGSEEIQIPREELVYCLLDTSIFIECKPFGQINWPSLLDTKQVCLLVASPVLDELDRHKEDNPRRYKRERAQRVIRDLVAARKSSLPSGEHGVRDGVRLRFLNDPRMDQYPELDRTDKDARIIASALDFKAETGIAPHLMTADLNFQLRTERRGLEAELIERPNDLFLDDDRDDTERENTRLRREIQELRQREVSTHIQFLQDHRPELLDEYMINEERDSLPMGSSADSGSTLVWPRVDLHEPARATYDVRRLLHHAELDVVPCVVMAPDEWSGEPFDIEARVTATHQPQPTLAKLRVFVRSTLYRDPWVIPIV